MGLLEKLKSVFGSGGDGRTSTGDAEVTVEYAPDAESEHAVKGTDEVDPSTGAAEDESAEPGEPDEGEAEPEEAETAAEEAADTAESPSVDEVKGIGPTYSGRLADAGVGTVADLAAADPETVAEAAEVSVSRAEDWIERARSRT